MTTRIRAKRFRTFSDLQGVADSHSLNERLGRISERNNILHGSGVLFAPLPGFYLGYCGPLHVETIMQQNLFYDEPVFVATLVTDGVARYVTGEASGYSFSLKKNMFLAGYWDHLDVRTILPQQDSYSHIGFMFTKTALETYFGESASNEIRELIKNKGDSGHTVVGDALSDTVFRAQRSVVDTQNCSMSDMLALRGVALNCFAMLVNNISSLGSRAKAYPPHQTDVQRIARLKEYIDDNFLMINTVREICARFGMSFSKANNLFKTMYLVTIAQYLHDYKMAYAYSRLVSRECNVTECAMEVGYSNISHFITSFKKRYNLTPKAATRLHAQPSQ